MLPEANPDPLEAFDLALFMVSEGIFSTCPPAIVDRVKRLDRLMDKAHQRNRMHTLDTLGTAQAEIIAAHYGLA